MALQDTDLLLVQRSSASYKMAATELSEYLGGGNSSVTVSATAPSAPQNGDMWWNSEDGNLYIYYTDVDSAQWVPSNSEAGGFVNATVGPNVPANASGGDLWYSTEDARLYIYDGAVWIDASPAAAPNISTISDTAPATPASGDLWYDLDSARLYVYNGQFWVDSAPGYGIQDGAVGGAQLADDINIVTTGDITATSYNTGQLAGFRNQLINGGFETWQRGEGSFTAQFAYTTDRWYLALGGGSVQRFRDVGLPTGNAIQIDSAATIGQLVELPVTNNGTCAPGPFMPGTTWTFSFYSTNDSVSAQTNMSFREGSTDDSPTLISAVVSFTKTGETITGANGTYTRYSATMTVNNTAVGVNKGMLITIPTGAGDKITMAQLEPGPVATPFEHRFNELTLCQRYYYFAVIGGKFGAQIGRPGSGSKQLFLDYQPPVNLRTYTDATVTLSDAKIYSNTSDTATSTSGISSRNAGVTQSRAFRLGVNYGSGSNQSNAYGWRVLARIDAEL